VLFTKIRRAVPTMSQEAMFAEKLARKTNPINLTIKLLERYRISAPIATIADRTVCAIAKYK